METQLLDQDGQEKEDFIPSDGLADATALAQAEDEHLLPVQLVEFCAVAAQETVRAESGGVFPQLTAEQRHGSSE